MPSQGQPTSRTTTNRDAWLAVIAAVVLCAAAIYPAIISGTLRSRAAFDQVNYHEKTVRTFAQELPNPRLDDYLSATTPGYHLVVAAVARAVVGPQLSAGVDLTPADHRAGAQIAGERRLLQACGAVFSLGFVGVLAWWITRKTGNAAAGITMAAIVGASPYVWQSGAFLLPDNSAWLACLGVVLAVLRGVSSEKPWKWLVFAGVLALAAVWLRQIHLWTCGVVWAGAVVCSARVRSAGPLLAVGDALPVGAWRNTPWSGWLWRGVLGVAVTVPAFASVAWFASLWGGLVPPSFKHWYTTGAVQLGTPAFVLTLLAGYGVVLAPWWFGCARLAWVAHRGGLIIALMVGLALSLVGPTEPGFATGRFGGVWGVVDVVPSVLGRSPLITLGAVCGAALVAVLLSGMRAGERWVMLAALAGFAAAQSASEQLWQRYSEPWVLVWLVVACALVGRGERAREGVDGGRGVAVGWKLAAPLVLALGLAGVTAIGFARSGIARDEGAAIGRIEPAPSEQGK